LFFVEPEVKGQWTVLVGYLTISTINFYQTLYRRQYHLPFSNTAHTFPLHGARNTVQQLLHKTLNFISPELWLKQARADSIHYNI